MIYRVKKNFKMFEPLIKKAITNRRFTQLTNLETVYEDLTSGLSQLWYCHDEEGEAIILTRIEWYPETKILEVNYVSGENIEGLFLESYNELKRFANNNNCKQLRGFGRKGWLKLIPDEYKLLVQWDVEV